MEKDKNFKISSLLMALLQAVLVLILFMIPELVVGFLASNMAKSAGFGNDVAAYYQKYQAVFLVMGQIISIILFSFVIRRRSKVFKKRYDRVYLKKRKISFDDILKIIVIALGLMELINISVGIMMAVSKFIPQIQSSFNTYTEISQDLMVSNSLIAVIGISILAPINEELMLRGVLFTENERILPYTTAIILNALAFAIFHMNLFQGVYAFVGGIVICSVYYYTESIQASILVHFLNNTLSVIMSTHQTFLMRYGIVLQIVFILSMVFMFKFLADFKRQRQNRYMMEDDVGVI